MSVVDKYNSRALAWSKHPISLYLYFDRTSDFVSFKSKPGFALQELENNMQEIHIRGTWDGPFYRIVYVL